MASTESEAAVAAHEMGFPSCSKYRRRRFSTKVMSVEWRWCSTNKTWRLPPRKCLLRCVPPAPMRPSGEYWSNRR